MNPGRIHNNRRRFRSSRISAGLSCSCNFASNDPKLENKLSALELFELVRLVRLHIPIRDTAGQWGMQEKGFDPD